MIIERMEPIKKILYLPILSLYCPIKGALIIEKIPVMKYNIGNASIEIPMLWTLNALPKGISIKPPVTNKALNPKALM
jgi:hypothetical protein